MTRPPRLSDIEIHRALSTLAGWTREGDAIRRTFTFDGFPAAVEFITKVVPIAEAMEHHPDVDLRYNKVTVTLSTHDAGGLTALDLTQAERISAL
jgi:4a-hydroxytetrahydrobiopterin dehydratase